MANHPIDDVIIDASDVSKSSFRAFIKARARLRFADANAVRATSLTGHLGGIYVADIRSFFDLDASDVTSADDGVGVIIDSAGNRFIQIDTVGADIYLPSGGSIDWDTGDVTLTHAAGGLTLDGYLAVTGSIASLTDLNVRACDDFIYISKNP